MKEKAFILVVGSGEAFSSEFGNTSYLFKARGYPGILFDCGYQIPERLWKLKRDTDIDMICLTHLHADHVFGIVPLVCRYWEEGRKKPLQFVGGRGIEGYVRRLIEMGYPGILTRLGFALEFKEISESKEVDFGKFEIRVARTEHSVRNFTYRVDFKDRAIRSFAVSGDGHITPETCELVNDVGVHLQEIYTLRKPIPVHMDLKAFEKWATRSRMDKIGVAHHSRAEVSAIHRRVSALAKKDPRWFSAKPGMKISLR